MSRYFKMNFGVTVGAQEAGLLTLDTGCVFFDEKRSTYLTVNLAAKSPTEESPNIRVVTKVSAEKRGVEGVSFGERDELRALLVEAKEAAKETFFGFATDERIL